MKDWQIIYKTGNGFHAEMVKGILDENEMQPVLVDKKDTSYHFGLFEIYVAPENVMRALKIIEHDIRFE
jgi:hypothetical protein